MDKTCRRQLKNSSIAGICDLCGSHGIKVAGVVKFSDGDPKIASAYLQVGDLLIGRTLSSRPMYLYLGEELGFVNMTKATLDADTVAVDLRLERLHGYGYYFAILRPSMGL